MTFLQDWDAVSIEMLEKAPAEKPVMSHYPPFDTIDLEQSAKRHSISRLCGSTFADSDLENQIIRLGGTAAGSYTDAPRFAPYVAAGYFVAHSSFLSEVPFDPVRIFRTSLCSTNEFFETRHNSHMIFLHSSCRGFSWVSIFFFTIFSTSTN